MVIKFLENTIGKYKAKQWVKNLKREPVAINLRDIKTFAVLAEVNSAEQVGAVEQALQLFSAQQIACDWVVVITAAKERPEYIPADWHCIDGKSVNVMGYLSGEAQNKLPIEPVDLFCNFCLKSSILTTQIISQTSAKCMAGFDLEEEINFNDLSISNVDNSSVLDLSNNIIRYLKVLNN
jgi:hypothetical protein